MIKGLYKLLNTYLVNKATNVVIKTTPIIVFWCLFFILLVKYAVQPDNCLLKQKIIKIKENQEK